MKSVIKLIIGFAVTFLLMGVLYYVNERGDKENHLESDIPGGKPVSGERLFEQTCRELTKKIEEQEAALAFLIAEKSSSDDDTKLDERMKQFELSFDKKLKEFESTVTALITEKLSAVNSDYDSIADQNIPETSTETTEEEGLAQMNALTDTIEAAFNYELVDQEWSGDAENLLYEKFSDSNIDGLEVNSAVCRGSFCRVELLFKSDSVSMENSVQQLKQHLPWNGEILFQTNDIRSGKGVLYLAKEGHLLPRPRGSSTSE